MSQPQSKSVAVITSTIGRSELVRAIESVQAQTYPCKHYVFVDGSQFAEQAKEILDRYPNVVATYLPMNTGADGWTNSSINAIAPFLTKEDIICYLDDDNWYEPNHVETCVKRLEETGADYVYALRNFYSPEREFISEDVIESIGLYEDKIQYPVSYDITVEKQTFQLNTTLNKERHIDTNCYAVKKETALRISQAWYSGKLNDTNVFNQLIALGTVGKCTKHFSVNYTLEAEKFDPAIVNIFVERGFSKETGQNACFAVVKYFNELNLSHYGNQYPWAYE